MGMHPNPFLFLSSALVLATSFTGPTCLGGLGGTHGNGIEVTEERKVGVFTKVHLIAPFDVKVHPGKQITLVLTTDTNIAPLVVTKVVGDTPGDFEYRKPPPRRQERGGHHPARISGRANGRLWRRGGARIPGRTGRGH